MRMGILDVSDNQCLHTLPLDQIRRISPSNPPHLLVSLPPPPPPGMQTGQSNSRFTLRRFGLFICGAFAHSLILFYLTIELLDLNLANLDGQQSDFWAAGTSVLSNLIITVTAVLGLHTRSWHWSHVYIYVGRLNLRPQLSSPNPGILGT
jgi:hypothetical protein